MDPGPRFEKRCCLSSNENPIVEIKVIRLSYLHNKIFLYW